MLRVSLRRVLAVLFAGVLASTCAEARGQGARDPLPAGARLRLGSVRLQHGGPVLGLAFAHDGKVLASAAADHTVRLWDRADGRERLRLRHEWVCQVALSPDGQLLASAGDNGTLCLWDARTGKLLRRLTGHQAAVLCLAFSADSRTLLSGSADHTARLWAVASGGELLRFAKNEGPIKGVGFVQGRGVLVTAGKGIRLWEITGEAVRSFADGEAVSCLALAPDGKSLATADGNALRLWDATTGRPQSLRKRGGTPVTALAFTADGGTLVSSESDGTLRLWRVATGEELHAIKRPGNSSSAAALALSPDGKTLAAAGGSNDIELRETATGKLLPPGAEEPERVATVACSANGKWIATGSRAGSVCLWEAATGREQGRLGKSGMGDVAVALSADGKVLAACGADGAVRLWDVVTRKELHTLPAPAKGKPRLLRFSPDGKFLAVSFSGRDDGDVVQMFDVSSGKAGQEIAVPAYVARFAFSVDGKLLATTLEGKVRTWDAGGKLVREYATGAGTGGGVAFSPDGRLLAAAGPDGVISLFDVATGQALRHLAGHDSATHALAFSPDGRLLASGGHDAQLAVWEVASGQAVCRFSGHAGPVRFVAFLPDGRRFLSAGDDSTALLWDVTGRSPGGARPAPPGAAERLRLWDDLGSFEAARAYSALWRLADNPEQSVGLLYEGLKPVLGTDAARIQRLIAQLDHNRFALREKASAALRSLGDLAAPALRRALANKPTLEAERRIEELLSRLKTDPQAAERERLRRLRSLSALEQGGTAAARKVLREVAERAADEELRQVARAALHRLAATGS